MSWRCWTLRCSIGSGRMAPDKGDQATRRNPMLFTAFLTGLRRGADKLGPECHVLGEFSHLQIVVDGIDGSEPVHLEPSQSRPRANHSQQHTTRVGDTAYPIPCELDI